MHGQGHGREHEHDGAPCRSLGKKSSRSARAEGRLATGATEGARQIRSLTALQHDDDDQ